MDLQQRIAEIEKALHSQNEIDFSVLDAPAPERHSFDHRFDKPDPSVDAPPAPTPAREEANPFDFLDSHQLKARANANPYAGAAPRAKPKQYDTIAAKFGLGILDDDDFDEYTVFDAFVTNMRVCPSTLSDSGRYYYVEHRSFLPNTPGAILRSGTDKTGRCLAVANLPLTGANSIGIGNYEADPQSVVWESMGKTGFWTHMNYKFEHEIPSGRRTTFKWIRTRNNIIDDQGDLVLVEDNKEDLILAEYLGKGLLKWKKRGRLRIKRVEAFGETWELIVLLTWASIVEVGTLSIFYLPLWQGEDTVLVLPVTAGRCYAMPQFLGSWHRALFLNPDASADLCLEQLSRRRARIRRYSPTHLIGV
jgi:hypothetical protein